MKPYTVPMLVVVGMGLMALFGAAYWTHHTKMRLADAYRELHHALKIDLKEISDKSELDKKATEKIEKLEQVISGYPKTPVAVEATYHLAQVAFDQSDYDRAIKLFTEFRDRYAKEELFTTLATISIADAYFAKTDFLTAEKKYAQFIDTYSLSENAGHLMPQAKYQLALTKLLNGDADGAKNVLSDLLALSDDEVMDRKAQSLLSKIEIIPVADLRRVIMSVKPAEQSASESEIDDAVNVEIPASSEIPEGSGGRPAEESDP